MATMHDVARLAQVSVSTVSYVLTGTRRPSGVAATSTTCAGWPASGCSTASC
ncbi:LacI family DNA-binding transcriptional regulator [Micromonospora sp. NPDC051141]|uniref:LacI family DNA-binding transcriptional regulator n=1 Tax=Micromonospora sp. NPDC051141 TaxID=3364284 RepID=UPI0037BDBFA1